MAANVEIVRRAYERFLGAGGFVRELAADDFIWGMSHYEGWLEEPEYVGAEGADRFLREWTAAWDDWELEVDALHDAGSRVVAITRQRGRSKATGVLVDMEFAQVWTLSGGKVSRIETYSDRREALESVGLSG